MVQFAKLSLKTVILFAFLTQTGCKKSQTTNTDLEVQPSAEFTTDKAEYKAGETIHLINTSSDSERFRWTFPDGQTGKSSNADFFVSESQVDQTLTFKLEAFSKNGTRSDYSVKTVKAKATEGQLVLYTFFGSLLGANADILVDGKAFVQVTFSTNTSVPSCGQAGYPTLNIPIGAHSITVNKGGLTYGPKVVQITSGGCAICQI
ncbi:MAG: hypothetical protein PSX36_08920 [bacterium]|nr:hypothetical protein [bacterium]